MEETILKKIEKLEKEVENLKLKRLHTTIIWCSVVATLIVSITITSYCKKQFNNIYEILKIIIVIQNQQPIKKEKRMQQEEAEITNLPKDSRVDKNIDAKISITQETIDCVAAHIKAYHEQGKYNEIADLGKACEICKRKESCYETNAFGFDWLGIMSPILEKSDLKLSMIREYKSKKSLALTVKELMDIMEKRRYTQSEIDEILVRLRKISYLKKAYKALAEEDEKDR